jgi:hypothetical protein
MNKAALIPVLIQVLLTFSLIGAMARGRVQSIMAGETSVADIALAQPAWPTRMMKIDRAFHNQLETPTMFYGLVALAAGLGALSWTFVALEWAYVALRLVHATIHVTSNHVPTRFRVFALSLVPLGGLALTLAWTVLAA